MLRRPYQARSSSSEYAIKYLRESRESEQHTKELDADFEACDKKEEEEVEEEEDTQGWKSKRACHHRKLAMSLTRPSWPNTAMFRNARF